jgi:hypothetical protein
LCSTIPISKLNINYQFPMCQTDTKAGFGIGYALSYESNSNISTVSNDGDDPTTNPQAEMGTINTPQDAEGTAATGAEDNHSVQATTSAHTPEVVPTQSIHSESSAPSTPQHRAADRLSVQPPGADSVPPSTVPAAASEAAPNNSLLGNLVSLSSSSAKKLLGTPLSMSRSASNVADAADAEGNDTHNNFNTAVASSAKDANRDKEVLLLKKTLKKKNTVSKN